MKKLYNGVTLYAITRTLVTGHCAQTLHLRLGYSVAVSAQGYLSVIEWQIYHRVVSGVLRDAQTLPSQQHTSVQTLGCARAAMHQSAQSREFEGNSYSCTGSAEGNRLMNEGQLYHRVVSGVLRDAQTSASRSHTRVQSAPRVCARIAGSDEQRVTETSSE